MKRLIVLLLVALLLGGCVSDAGIAVGLLQLLSEVGSMAPEAPVCPVMGKVPGCPDLTEQALATR